MKYLLLNITCVGLFFLTFACQGEKDVSSEKLCKCTLEPFYTKTSVKDSIAKNEGVSFNSKGSASMGFGKKGVDAEASLDLQENSSNNSVSEKKSEIDIEEDKMFFIFYESQRKRYCADYERICNKSSLNDSIKDERLDGVIKQFNQSIDQFWSNYQKKKKPDDQKGNTELKALDNKANKGINGDNNKAIIDSDNSSIEEINAPNALIVTKNQQGGSNTIVNPTVEAPLPEVKMKSWDVRNKKTSQIYNRAHRRDTINLPNEKIKESFLFQNELLVTYKATLSRNSIVFILQRKDVRICYTKLEGSGILSLTSGTIKGGINEGFYGISIKNPQNGTYRIIIHTKAELLAPLNELTIAL